MGPEEKFKRDIELVLNDLLNGLVDDLKREKLTGLASKLILLYDKRLVKINHSIMELICSKYLIEKGWDVDIEVPLDEKLICDIYARKNGERVIVEVETGYVSPENAVDPISYWEARVVGKAARYSKYADKFGFGVPPYHILKFPELFLKLPEKRSLDEAFKVKILCDQYYKNPPIEIEEIMKAKIDFIYIINVDKRLVNEMSINVYSKIHRINYFYF